MDTRVKAIMQIVISLILIFAGVYLIVAHGYSDATQKIAAGWIGVVVGYWLR
jgi:hypothetical protein